jgi:Tfp pilus assembly protein PilN
MKKMHIDLAPPSLRRTIYRTPRAAWSLALVAIGLLPAVVVHVNKYTDGLRRYEMQIASMRAHEQAPAALKVAARRPQMPPGRAAAINAAIMQLNLPWRELHDAVQAATPPSVALLALEPDAGKRELRITAEATISDDMISYVERMQAQEWFSGVALARHEINEQDPNRPIRFQLDAQWRQP